MTADSWRNCYAKLEGNASYKFDTNNFDCKQRFDHKRTIQDVFNFYNPECTLDTFCRFNRCSQSGKRWEATRLLASVSFLVVMSLMLYNLLIAYFSAIYETIAEQSQGFWAYWRFTTVQRYAKKEHASTNFARFFYKWVSKYGSSLVN